MKKTKAAIAGLIVSNIVAMGLISSGFIYLGSQHVVQRLENYNRDMGQRIEKVERLLSPQENRSAGTIYNAYTKRMEVTAYTCGPESTGKSPGHPECSVTASGYKINVGVGEKLVAAPPEIPFGTKMYVPGYGLAVVRDRGGAITGNRLDVYFDNLETAYHWGRKQIDVVIFR